MWDDESERGKRGKIEGFGDDSSSSSSSCSSAIIGVFEVSSAASAICASRRKRERNDYSCCGVLRFKVAKWQLSQRIRNEYTRGRELGP